VCDEPRTKVRLRPCGSRALRRTIAQRPAPDAFVRRPRIDPVFAQRGFEARQGDAELLTGKDWQAAREQAIERQRLVRSQRPRDDDSVPCRPAGLALVARGKERTMQRRVWLALAHTSRESC